MPQLVKDEIHVEDLEPVRELEDTYNENQEALAVATYNNPQQQAIAVSVVDNICGNIDTAKNCLNIAVELVKMRKYTKINPSKS